MVNGTGRLHRLQASVFVALLVVVAALVAGPDVSPARASELGKEKFKVGDKAPDFTAADLGGRQLKLSSLAGNKVLLLNFWGLRCGACLEEMPFLEAIGKKYADKAFAVWGVNTDGVDAKIVVETLKEVQVSATYPLLVDPEFTVTDVYTNFLVPLTIVIGKDGAVKYIHTGFEKGTEKQYEEAVNKALGI